MEDHQKQRKKIILSVIIINYNLEEEISDCLSSLIKTLSEIEKFSDSFEVIILDNNSPNKKLPELERKFGTHNIHFLYSDINLGFGKGCNLAASKANGKYLLFLNPDTIVTEDIFTPILDIFENDDAIGIIGPKQQIRKPFFDFSAGYSPNLFFEIFNVAGLGIFLEGLFMYALTKLYSEKYFNVNWILGAAIFIKKELFEKVNGFDRAFFMFFEEVDLCKRVNAEGYRIIYNHTQKIHHIGSVSGKRNYFLYTVRTYASKYLYLTKHFKFPLKQLMIQLLYFQIFTQILIWLSLSPLSYSKSRQKIKSFLYLLKHRMRNEIDLN